MEPRAYLQNQLDWLRNRIQSLDGPGPGPSAPPKTQADDSDTSSPRERTRLHHCDVMRGRLGAREPSAARQQVQISPPGTAPMLRAQRLLLLNQLYVCVNVFYTSVCDIDTKLDIAKYQMNKIIEQSVRLFFYLKKLLKVQVPDYGWYNYL